MIGLTEAKAVIQQALDFHKAQALYRENGIEQERPPMHMVFTGNPGVGKSHAARLFAHIMEDNGLIEIGKIFEVSRANLVGKYISHTAPLVMDVFKQAKGGILFVDEVHTLLDNRENSFGDEAIDALVKQMEDMRNEVIVILAGYPAEIEALLTRNPGLRSRINFHVPFSDYDTDELYAITELIANKQGLALADDVKPKLMTIYSAAVKQADAGNGRLARSLIEKARMKQASRLVKMNPAQISKSDFALTADDFEVPVFRQESRKIGFGAG